MTAGLVAPAAVPPGRETAREGTPEHSAGRLRRLACSPVAPLVVVGVVALLSLVSRGLWVETPRALVFDERYYVNAARTILSIPVPPGQPYLGASPGTDPNVEHPPLGKVLIATGMRVFGDRPLGWRAASLAFGTLAVLAMYGLVRAAGGSGWLAVGASSIMAADNLFLVHGRIATLDVFAVAFMLTGAALYIRRRPWLAGFVLGVGACTKVVVAYALAVLVVVEVLRVVLPDPGPRPGLRLAARQAIRPLAVCISTAAVSYLAVLSVLDARLTTFGGPIAHTRHMLGYAGNQRAQTDPPEGVAFAPTSNPVQWLVNREPIVYYRSTPSPSSSATVLFQGRMSPFVAYLAVPAFLAAAWGAARARDDVARLAAAWCLTTFLIFVVVTLDHPYNYLYYMLAVLPGVYVALARLFASGRLPRPVGLAFGLATAYGVWALYPIRP